LRSCQLERERSGKGTNRLALNTQRGAIVAAATERPVSLELQLEQKQLFIHHSSARFLPFPYIARRMNMEYRLTPCHESVPLDKLIGQYFLDHRSELRQRLSDCFAHPHLC